MSSFDETMRRLAEHTRPQPDEEARLRRRMRRTRRPTAPLPRRRWLPVELAGFALAAAAVAAVVVNLPGLPGGRVVRLEAAEPSALEVREGVDLTYAGVGTLYHRPRGLTEVDWEFGTLDLEVAPGQGLAVDIWTEEALVSVVGTRFSVERDRIGTLVSVAEGTVAVTCGEVRALAEAGAVQRCLAAEPDFVGHLDVLRRRDAGPDALLAVADLGLSRDREGTWTYFELLAVRIGALADLGRGDEALDALDLYLATGKPVRRARYLALGATLAAGLGDCERAERHRTALAELDAEAAAAVPACPARSNRPSTASEADGR